MPPTSSTIRTVLISPKPSNWDGDQGKILKTGLLWAGAEHKSQKNAITTVLSAIRLRVNVQRARPDILSATELACRKSHVSPSVPSVISSREFVPRVNRRI